VLWLRRLCSCLGEDGLVERCVPFSLFSVLLAEFFLLGGRIVFTATVALLGFQRNTGS
jgi:hypothetical protein